MLKIAFHPLYVLPLLEKHRFPMEKYELLPQQLIYEGTCISDNFFKPDLPNDKHIVALHDLDYYYSFLNLTLDQKAVRRIGFPLSEVLVERERLLVQGTIQAALYALTHGVAMNIAGGTHHAYSDRGEGFCMLNDQAIAANYLRTEKLAKQILIIDLDVHQGNGTAEICKNIPEIFTFSMHCERNYPFQKEKSDLDIGLPEHTNDTDYLAILEDTLDNLFLELKPDFVFYQAGVDVLATDKLGKLNLSLLGCKQRDNIVFTKCKAQQVPVVCCMGGGYSENINHILEAHANTYKLAQEIYF